MTSASLWRAFSELTCRVCYSPVACATDETTQSCHTAIVVCPIPFQGGATMLLTAHSYFAALPIPRPTCCAVQHQQLNLHNSLTVFSTLHVAQLWRGVLEPFVAAVLLSSQHELVPPRLPFSTSSNTTSVLRLLTTSMLTTRWHR